MNDPTYSLPPKSKFKYVEEVAAVALAFSVVDESIARTCRKLDDLHLELREIELKLFDERAHLNATD